MGNLFVAVWSVYAILLYRSRGKLNTCDRGLCIHVQLNVCYRKSRWAQSYNIR